MTDEQQMNQNQTNLLLLLGAKELAIAELNGVIKRQEAQVKELQAKVEALSTENSVLRAEAQSED